MDVNRVVFHGLSLAEWSSTVPFHPKIYFKRLIFNRPTDSNKGVATQNSRGVFLISLN